MKKIYYLLLAACFIGISLNAEEEYEKNPEYEEFLASIEWSEIFGSDDIFDPNSEPDPVDVDVQCANEGHFTPSDFRRFSNFLYTMNSNWTFEECVSALGVFFCRVAIDLEHRSGKKTSIIHREMISRYFINTRFDKINTEIVRRGGQSLKLSDFEIVHQKSAQYMEYYYLNGFYVNFYGELPKGMVIVGQHRTWVDVPLDEMETIFYVQGFAGALMIIIPNPVVSQMGIRMLAGAVTEYMAYQVIKNQNKKCLEYDPSVEELNELLMAQ